MAGEHLGKIIFEKKGLMTLGHFQAMANPCIIFVDSVNNNDELIQNTIRLMAEEVWRIEQKYSRYLADSALSKINDTQGQSIQIDSETYHLLQLSDVLWQESGGRFDISSGIFRKIWHFDQQHLSKQPIPSQSDIEQLQDFIGWDRVEFNQQEINLPKGMQLDFGGIGKEYAADRCAAIANKLIGKSVLVNLGGDVVALGSKADKSPWQIGIETKQGGGKVWKQIPLTNGAIATSGDVYKSLIYQGKRYGHIINALTGYPVKNSPRTVTVAAPNCTEAGMLSTLALLQGQQAEQFLEEQGRPFWIQR